MLEQLWNKSDSVNKVVVSCQQLVRNFLTTWNNLCKQNLLTAVQTNLKDIWIWIYIKFSEFSWVVVPKIPEYYYYYYIVLNQRCLKNVTARHNKRSNHSFLNFYNQICYQIFAFSIILIAGGLLSSWFIIF